MRSSAAALLTFASTLAAAHPGHGIEADSHWHASDAWGFLLVGALIVLAIWLSRGGK